MPNAVTGQAAGAGATIVSNAVGSMDASGNASLTTLQQLSVSVEYDDRYDITLSAANSTKLVNAFTVSGAGDQFTATLSNSSDFQDVLAFAMENAVLVTKTSAADPEGPDASVAEDEGLPLGTVINNGILNQFKQLFTDTLPNILQSDWTMESGVDWVGGAADMAGKLVDAECEILAQQIPESNYELYMDVSENPGTSALSLKHGDSVIFVMEVNVAAIARAITKTPGLASDAGASNVAGGDVAPYGYNTNINSYANNSRRVAFKLTVSKDPENTDDDKLASLNP
jgi:hypothetical protein